MATKKKSSAAERFAEYLKSTVKEEEARRTTPFGSIRASFRKRTTKEAISAVSKRKEIAEFLEELRKEDEEASTSKIYRNTSSSIQTSNSSLSLDSANPMFLSHNQRAQTNRSEKGYGNSTMNSIPESSFSVSPFSQVYALTTISKSSQQEYDQTFKRENIGNIATLSNLDVASLKLVGVKVGDAGQIVAAIKKIRGNATPENRSTTRTQQSIAAKPIIKSQETSNSFGLQKVNQKGRFVSVSLQGVNIRKAQNAFSKN